MNTKITLLTEGQVWGNEQEKQLEVLKKYGTKSAISDLVILTGGYCEDSCTYMAPDDNSLRGRTGWAYTRSSDGDGDVRGVYKDGYSDHGYRFKRNGAVRPALQSSSVFSQISPNRVRGYNGTEEVYYGEYPQYAPDKEIQTILESEYQNRRLQQTGKNYTFDRNAYNDYSQDFQAVTYDEYEYNGKKYIRVKANFCISVFVLSNDEVYKNGDYVWVEVSPIVWLIDDETKILVSKIGLLSGIRFDTIKKKYNGNFKKTEMYDYLNKFFIKEIIPSKSINVSDKKELSKVEQLIIDLEKYLEDFKDSEKIVTKVNNLLDEYNKKIDLIKENKLVFCDLKGLEEKLIIDLTIILDKVKQIRENNNIYYELLKLINDLMLIINKEEITVSEENNLLKDFTIIFNNCIPFLHENDSNLIKEKIVNILNKEQEKINEYLDYTENVDDYKKVNINYYSISEFEIEIRKNIQPLLEILNNMVIKRDIQLEVTKSIQEIINNLFDVSKKRSLSKSLNVINELVTEINDLLVFVGNENNRNKLLEILNIEIDYNKSVTEIVEYVNNIIISLYKFKLELEENKKDSDKINNSYVKIRLKTKCNSDNKYSDKINNSYVKIRLKTKCNSDNK